MNLFYISKLFLSCAEEFPVEEYQIDGSAGDAGVSYVEDGLEEYEVLSAPDGNPGREDGVYQREVEHVDYLAEAYGGVAASGREELGDLGVGGFGEEGAVEEAVEDIAAGADHNQGDADKDAHRGFGTLEETAEENDHRHYQSYPEKDEDVFADIPAEGHSEGHSLVFDEGELEPVAEDVD